MKIAGNSPIAGVKAALFGGDWRAHFDLRMSGLKASFFALAATIGLYLFCAYGTGQKIVQAGAGQPSISGGALAIILTLFGLTFPVMAYMTCQLMSRMDVFRPWVIVRNWAILALAIIMAAGFGLSLAGLLPYAVASQIALLAYIAILIIDIRLCQSVGEMDWIPAIFSACAISVVGMLVLLAGFASAAGL